MADFDTCGLSELIDSSGNQDNCYDNDFVNLSRRSSESSGLSVEKKAYVNGLHSKNNGSAEDKSTGREVILLSGQELLEESRTEPFYDQITQGGQKMGQAATDYCFSGGTAKAKVFKSPFTGPLSTIPECEITIPNTGDISGFSCDQFSNFLRCLKVDERVVSHLHRKSVDGKRFARLKDSELEPLGLKNPVVLFFREKSVGKKTKLKQFML